jgi:hypothetical protein
MIEAMKAPLINSDLVSNEMIAPVKGQTESLSDGQAFAELFSSEVEVDGEIKNPKINLAQSSETEEVEQTLAKNVDTKSQKINLNNEFVSLDTKKLNTTEDFISQKISLKQPGLEKADGESLELPNAEAKMIKGEDNTKNDKLSNLLKNFNKTSNTDETIFKSKAENVATADLKTGADSAAVKANVFSLSTLVGEKKENASTADKNVAVKNSDEQQPTLAKILDFRPTTMNPEAAVLETGKAEAIDNKAPAKVLDLSSVQISNNTSKNEIIQKIADYIQTNHLANQSEVELTVKHQDLGTFQINVQKMKGATDIKMSIAANEQEGFKFFQKFEGELVRTLESAGIKVADFKVTTSQMNFSSSFAQDSGAKDGQGGRQQWSESSSFREESWQKSSSDERRQDSDRRRDIWAQYRERFGA